MLSRHTRVEGAKRARAPCLQCWPWAVPVFTCPWDYIWSTIYNGTPLIRATPEASTGLLLNSPTHVDGAESWKNG